MLYRASWSGVDAYSTLQSNSGTASTDPLADFNGRADLVRDGRSNNFLFRADACECRQKGHICASYILLPPQISLFLLSIPILKSLLHIFPR